MFCARIPALEEDLPSDRHPVPPKILIAASDASTCLYAVERVRCETYALCKLGAWVTLNELERLKLAYCSQPKATSAQRASSPGNEWWNPLAIRINLKHERGRCQKQKQVHPENFRLCLKSPLPATIAASTVVEEISIIETRDEATIELNETLNEPPPEPLTQDPDETLRMIRAQYQEALYVSQVRTH